MLSGTWSGQNYTCGQSVNGGSMFNVREANLTHDVHDECTLVLVIHIDHNSPSFHIQPALLFGQF